MVIDHGTGVAVRLLGAAGTLTALNVAVTDFCASIVTVQLAAVPVQPPDHPTKVDPATAAAVRVTVDLPGNFAVHVEPQLIPAGVDDIVPPPAPDLTVFKIAGVIALAVLEYGDVPPLLNARTL